MAQRARTVTSTRLRIGSSSTIPAASFTFSRDATLQQFTTTAGAYKLARYRWAWRKRAVVDSANNYTNFFDLVTAVNLTGTAWRNRSRTSSMWRIWMGIFALQHIVGNWDSYGYEPGQERLHLQTRSTTGSG